MLVKAHTYLVISRFVEQHFFQSGRPFTCIHCASSNAFFL